MCPPPSSSFEGSTPWPWRLEEKEGGSWHRLTLSCPDWVNAISDATVDLGLDGVCVVPRMTAHGKEVSGAKIDLPPEAPRIDTEQAKCKFSKKRRAFLVEWPAKANPAEEAQELGAPPSAATLPASPARRSSDEASDTAAAPCDTAVSTPEQEDADAQEAATKSAKAWKDEGNAAFKAKEVEKAIRLYSLGLLSGGEKGEEACALFSNRALCEHQLGRYEEAVADAACAAELKPDFAKAYLRGGLALRQLGRCRDGFKFMEKAPTAVIMSNPEVGALHKELRGLAEEEEERELAKLEGPARGKARGDQFFKKARFEDAAHAYTDGIEACSEAERHSELGLALLNNRAACFHQLSDYSAVVRDAGEVLAWDPGNIKARLRRMLAYEPLEKYKAALEDARFVLMRDPRNDLANKIQHRLSKLVRELERGH